MPKTFCLGRNRPVALGPRLSLKNYLNVAQLPVPPASMDYTVAAKTSLAQMYDNDRLGDCLTEGTLVASGNTSHVVRGRYDGPIVILTTASGKKLAVTPNHAILTKSGFRRAKTLQKGDHLVCTSRPDVLPGPSILSGKAHVYDSPTAIEEIFSASVSSGNAALKVMPVAIDFHGDERFMNGDVDIVGTNGLLRREFYPALCKPHTKYQVGPARQLQRRLARSGTTLLRSFRRFASALGDICIGSYGPTLCYAQFGVPESQRLRLRAKRVSGHDYRRLESPSADAGLPTQLLENLSGHISGNPRSKVGVLVLPPSTRGNRFALSPDLYASNRQPPADGLGTDSDLARNLAERYPGLVDVDDLVDVDFQRYTGHIYDLSTEQRWYSANGIIAHNCVIACMAHVEGVLTGNASIISAPFVNPTPLLFTNAQIISLYSAIGGYIPGRPNTDRGCDIVTALNYWVKKGAPIGSHEIASWMAVDANNMREVRTAIWLFENCVMGIELPDAYVNPFPQASGFVWGMEGKPDPNNGHCIPFLSYTPDGVGISTWGMLGMMKNGAVQNYGSEKDGGELYTVISQDILNKATEKAPNGLNWAQLVADFNMMHGTKLVVPPLPITL